MLFDWELFIDTLYQKLSLQICSTLQTFKGLGYWMYQEVKPNDTTLQLELIAHFLPAIFVSSSSCKIFFHFLRDGGGSRTFTQYDVSRGSSIHYFMQFFLYIINWMGHILLVPQMWPCFFSKYKGLLFICFCVTAPFDS